MSGRLPRVTVVGRQNVGKSTLVNRLHGRRETIAHEEPGVTRDRVELEAEWRGRRFALVDTGGYLAGARGVDALVSAQAEHAAGEADIVVLVTDVRTGVTEEDATLARRLRRSPVPVLLAVNKADRALDEPDAAAFLRLGLGEPLPVSALHGRGTGDLLDRVVQLLPKGGIEQAPDGEPRFALVGRPNVGKSSLFNRLVGEERSVVYEEAGTTRDAVDALVEWQGRRVRFVDTAGLRRQTRTQGLEYYSFVRAVRAIERAHVALLVLDASEGLTGEDKRIASRVMQGGRALAVAANKWDLTKERDRTYRDLVESFGPFARAGVARTSALTGAGVSRLPKALLELHGRWSKRVGTADVNRVIGDAQAERPPPAPVGRYRYGTQVHAAPPTFVLFGGRAPEPSYRRFIENRLRTTFGLEGVPIRLAFRSGRKRRG